MVLDGDRVWALLLAAQVTFFVSIVVDAGVFSVVRLILGTIYLTFLPGSLILLFLGVVPARKSTFVVYAFGASLVLIMVVGAAVSLLAPTVGLSRPLSSETIAFVALSLTVPASFGLRHKLSWRRIRIPVGRIWQPWPLALLLVPFASVFGSVLLVSEENSAGLIAVLVVVSLLPLIAVAGILRERWYPLAAWTGALALLYHGILPVPEEQIPSWQAVFMDQMGRWVPSLGRNIGGEGVLATSALTPIYATVTGLSLSVVVTVIYPFIMAFLPIVLLEAYRRQVPSTIAFLATCLLMFSYPFYTLFPNAGRTPIAVLFLSLIVLTMVDDNLTLFHKSVLGMGFALGLIVSHYGTSYMMLFALIGATTLISAGSVLNSRRNSETILRSNTLNRGPFVAFYLVLNLGWYIYTGGAKKFRLLVKNIIDQFLGLLFGRYTGTSANVIGKTYGSVSISLAKYLYIAFGILMGIGVVVRYLGRVRHGITIVSDEYLALAFAFVIMLGMSFFPGASGFGAARVMMIVFTVAAPFAFLGAKELVSMASLAGEDRKYTTPQNARGVLAVVLAVFLLLNSGVVAELVTGGYGPSHVVNQPRLENSENPLLRLQVEGCVECDIETRVWVLSHRDPDDRIYADNKAALEYSRAAVTARTGRLYSNPYYERLPEIRNGTAPGSYVMLLTHNHDASVVLAVWLYGDWIPLEELSSSLTKQDRIYSSGNTTIHRTPG